MCENTLELTDRNVFMATSDRRYVIDLNLLCFTWPTRDRMKGFRSHITMLARRLIGCVATIVRSGGWGLPVWFAGWHSLFRASSSVQVQRPKRKAPLLPRPNSLLPPALTLLIATAPLVFAENSAQKSCLSPLSQMGQAVFSEWRYLASYQVNLALRLLHDDRADTADLSSLDVPPDILEDAITNPDALARHILKAMNKLSCAGLPQDVELACSAVKGAPPRYEFEGTFISCHQSIDGLPVKGGSTSFSVLPNGSLYGAYIRLIDPALAFYPGKRWPDETTVRQLAVESFKRSEVPRKPVRQQILGSERYYDANGPQIALYHRECGVTTIDPRTLSLRYVCKNPPELPDWRPRGRNERLVLANPLHENFMGDGIVADHSAGYFLWGPASFDHTSRHNGNPGAADHGSYLYSISDRGDVRWSRHFPTAAELLVKPSAQGLLALSVDRSAPYEQELQVTVLNGTTGALETQKPSWRVPAGARYAWSDDGATVHATWHTFNKGVLVRFSSDGEELWRYSPPAGTALDSLALNQQGGTMLLLRKGSRWQVPSHRIEYVSPLGKSEGTVDLHQKRLGDPVLLRAIGKRAFLQGGYGRSGSQRGPLIREWNLEDGQLLNSVIASDQGQYRVSDEGTLLLGETDDWNGFVGEQTMGGTVLWREMLSAGRGTWHRMPPPSPGLNGQFVSSRVTRSDDQTQQSTAVLAVIDRQRARTDFSPCDPLLPAQRYQLHDKIAPNITVAPAQTLGLLNPRCPADAYRDFMDVRKVLRESIKDTVKGRFEQQQIHVQFEHTPSTDLLRSDAARDERWGLARLSPGTLWLRAHSDEVDLVLDAIANTILPHLITMEAIRDDIYRKSGVIVMVEYEQATLLESIKSAEAQMRHLRDLLDENTSQPADNNGGRLGPWDERKSMSSILYIFDEALHVHTPPSAQYAVHPLSTQSLTAASFHDFVAKVTSYSDENE